MSPSTALLLTVSLISATPAAPGFSSAQERANRVEAATRAGQQLLEERLKAKEERLKRSSSLAARLKKKVDEIRPKQPVPGPGGTITRTIEKPEPDSPPESAPRPGDVVAPRPELTREQAISASWAIDSSEIQLMGAQQAIAQARKYMAMARSPDPRQSQHFRKLAQERLAYADSRMDTASTSLLPVASLTGVIPPQPPPAKVLKNQVAPGFCTGQISGQSGAASACKELERIVEGLHRSLDPEDFDPQTLDPRALGLFDTGALRSAPAVPVVPRVQERFISLEELQRMGGEAEPKNDLESGGLQPLRDAVGSVAPELSSRPLIQACGPNREACASRDLLRLLASPDTREELRNIGGVALDVTFDLLQFSGMPEFRNGIAISLVEDPVLISLRRLYAAVEPYTRGSARFELPDSLRHPGSIERIIGLVLDPRQEDVVLVAQAARSPGRRLDLDMIVLALRQTWRDGKTMAVSLDPLEGSLGGPQYSRVINAPADSIVARTMLNADYAMKLLMGRVGFARGGDFRDLSLAAVAQRDFEPFVSRFWLVPRRLGHNAMQLSGSGRSLLLNTSIEALTEDVFFAGGRAVGTREQSLVPERWTAAFNQAYSDLEDSSSVEPPGVFVRLHGLVDAVTIARILRLNEIDYRVLSRFAELPYRRLAGDEAAPRYYPGVVTTQSAEDDSLWVSYGGVELDLRLGVDSIRSYADPLTRQLEAAVDGWRAPNEFSFRLNLAVALPVPTTTPPSNLSAALHAGELALAHEEFAVAVERFREAQEVDFLTPAVHSGLARAYLKQSRFQDATRALLRAIVLDPGDDSLRLVALDLAWQRDPRVAYPSFDEASKHDLSVYYGKLAGVALRRGRIEDVTRLADWASTLWEGNGDAHMIRHSSRSADDERAKRRDVVRAIRAYRRQVKAEIEGSSNRLAIALVVSASERIGRAGLRMVGTLTQVSPGQLVDISTWVTDLERAREEALEAEQHDSGLPDALALQAVAQAWLADLLGERQSASGLQAALRTADEAVGRFPDHPFTFGARAEVRQLAGDLRGALSDLDAAIRLAPALAELYGKRALVNVGLRRCERARMDLEITYKLTPPTMSIPEQFRDIVANCES